VSRSGDKLTKAFELGKDRLRRWRYTRKAPPQSTTDRHSQAIYGTGHWRGEQDLLPFRSGPALDESPYNVVWGSLALRSGENLGERAILRQQPRPASLRALSDTRTLVLGGNALRSIFEARLEVRLGMFASQADCLSSLTRIGMAPR
jgi:CRP-like cAMP-binding protein